jgi:hypothetical protein
LCRRKRREDENKRREERGGGGYSEGLYVYYGGRQFRVLELLS